MALFRKQIAGEVTAAAAPSSTSAGDGDGVFGHHPAHFLFMPKTECQDQWRPTAALPASLNIVDIVMWTMDAVLDVVL